MKTVSPFATLKTYTVLQVLLKCLDYNERRLQSVDIKLKEVYQEWGENVRHQVLQDLKTAKAALKREGIVIEKEMMSKQGVSIDFRHKGYRDTYAIWVEYLQGEVKLALKKYMQREHRSMKTY
ncbi:hypothetical protein [Caldalkalibacillus salinus]|uniref:hypothetical protein n=1 Tax=Caldalkalibacillus salinus TaxID=2803787 RepID=UPI00192105D8|nr:hypothetical protein [Caldalkalibacillus salinus]